jgi:secondary thiamine-phosphate synthase enzyme
LWPPSSSPHHRASKPSLRIIEGTIIGALKERAMRAHTDYLTMNTRKPREIVRITEDVARAVEASGVQEGLCLVSAMHITAGVYVNDDEPGFRSDLLAMLEEIAPSGADYEHHKTGEDNGDAHLKNILVGHQVVLPITAGTLDLGPWQQVFYAEFDGRRPKRVIVKIIGE